jgi:hypothetical protein
LALRLCFLRVVGVHMATPGLVSEPPWNHVDTSHSTPFETASKDIAYSDNIWTILLVMASVMAALQIGYLAGAVFCFVIGDPGGEVFDLPSELLQLRSPSAGGQGHSVKECKTVPGNCSVGIMGVLRACPSKASLRRTRRVPLRRNLAEYQGARGPHGARPKCQQPTSSESS